MIKLFTPGDKIKFTFTNPVYSELYMKDFEVEIAFLNMEDQCYMAYTPWGQDGISFDDASISKC